MTRCSSNLTLCTANGEVPANEKEQIGLNIGPFAAKTTALVLDDTPSVLTLRRRCMVEGYGFHWYPYQTPFTDHPTLGRMEHEVEHYVPFMSIHAGGITPFLSTGPLMPVAGVNTVAGAAVAHAATEDATFTRGKPRRVRVRARKPGKGEQTAWVNDDSRGKASTMTGRRRACWFRWP